MYSFKLSVYKKIVPCVAEPPFQNPGSATANSSYGYIDPRRKKRRQSGSTDPSPCCSRPYPSRSYYMAGLQGWHFADKQLALRPHPQQQFFTSNMVPWQLAARCLPINSRTASWLCIHSHRPKPSVHKYRQFVGSLVHYMTDSIDPDPDQIDCTCNRTAGACI